jgi:carboxylesterase type B
MPGLLDWSPVIDGVDVVGVPAELAAQGKAANVPVMLGTNANEGA